MRKSLLLVHPYIRRVCTYLSIGLLTVLTNLSASADQPTIGLVLSEEVLEVPLILAF